MEGTSVSSTTLNKLTASSNNNVTNTTLRQHRLLPSHPHISNNTNSTDKPKTVKLCFFKVSTIEHEYLQSIPNEIL